jgi:quinoprotein dehydrogenase-associated probable ABC transporter substrate-binding protein
MRKAVLAPKAIRTGLLTLALVIAGAGTTFAQTSDLVSKSHFRVCADPANAPMSDKEESGYENRLAELFAEKLGLPVQYTWYPMATGFVRNTLKANKCDVIMGYAQGHELVLNTNHYMTSAYTLVVPEDGPLSGVTELSDSALKDSVIGVVAGSPPATHMARNGLIGKARAYDLVVDRRYESPVLDMLDDLDAGEIDAAILWGPLAGPLVKTDHPGLKVTPLVKETLPPRLFFRITMGVRQGEKVWQRELNSLIRRHQDEINAILVDAGVPLLNDMGTDVLDVTN